VLKYGGTRTDLVGKKALPAEWFQLTLVVLRRHLGYAVVVENAR